MTRNSRVIRASPAALYGAFVDPAALVEWLPPGRMTGHMHCFDGRAGGGYRISLFHPEDEQAFRGKTAEREDAVEVRFVELVPPARIVEAIRFASDDPQFHGEMKMTATFEPRGDSTEVTLLFEDLPPGLRPADNEEGARLSLEQLATRFEI